MVEQELLESEFNVINPYYINPKKSRKEYGFWMETIKSPANLYLYIDQGLGKGNDINTTLTIKSYLGKIIYQSNHINTGLNEILSPLISRKNYSPIPSDFIGFRNMKFTDTENNLREKNPDIEFKEEAEKTVAAIGFGGWANAKKIDRYKKDLRDALDAKDISYSNRFFFLGYNAPYEVFNRKNEIIVELNSEN